jgi:HK97 family phage major capsid protein
VPTKLDQARARVLELIDELEQARAHPDQYTERQVLPLIGELNRLCDEGDHLAALERSRAQFKPVGGGNMSATSDRFSINEPDLYEPEGRSFFADLYHAQMKGDPAANERVQNHQRYEAEKRAVTSTTLGGIIPPAYLVDLYAKASRGGRVFADQCNGVALPDVGMSVIVPRLTQGTAAAAQTTQNTAVVTQDPTESDLTVNVNTIAGYSPVSRQAIERAAYSDQILFEDLTARYWAILDTYCLNGSGSNNQPLGLLNTSSIATSTASTATVAGVWPKIADVIQQINTNMTGIGYTATKVFMHPRRWGWFSAALDSSNRPLMPPSGAAFNTLGTGDQSGIGFVGQIHGLDAFVDPNLPTNLGASTNQDPLVVIAHPVVHLFERGNDPVTLSFEQQAGTSLQVNLVCFGYVAFTAGRYPGASGAVTGLGMVAPTF